MEAVLVFLEGVHALATVNMDRKWYAKNQQKDIGKWHRIVSVFRSLVFLCHLIVLIVITALQQATEEHTYFWISCSIYGLITLLILLFIGAQHKILSSYHLQLHPLLREEGNKQQHPGNITLF
ncbi:unnamed protein product [Caenorhabditis sp. 36 PRJEB53466]|nr:unnamed protein product [Caenorhabditis sp. 36 PRJEB53466]